jgi:hypothetical protein
MASIYERKYPSGRTTYRMVFTPKGLPRFSITFDEWESAADFAETHEKKYRENPEYYFQWREQNYYTMRKNGHRISHGIILSKARFFKEK